MHWAPKLTLPSTLRLTPQQFAEVCAANPETVLELAADGQLIERSPTGGDTSARNLTLGALLWLAVRQSALPLKVFDSSCGFLLPDGSVRSPDASLVRLELASPSDRPADLQRRMASWIDNGSSLGWLLLPDSRSVEVWRAADAGEGTLPQRIGEATRLDASPMFPGLAIDLKEIWIA